MAKGSTTFLLGAHMSTQGGVVRALERGHSIGCTTIQLFTKNASRWAAKDLDAADVRDFRSLRKQTRINPVFAHCSYLINIAVQGQFYQKSIDALTEEIIRGEQLGLDFVVLHPGAHMGNGHEDGLKRVVAALDCVIDRTEPARCKVVIENTAGQGTCIGCSFEHFDYILTHVAHPDRIGFCVDTCHMFASGYDIRNEATYQESMKKLLDCVPRNKILAFHLNDSKRPLNSRVDRHEHIGQGYIGDAAFRCLLTDPRFARIPKVLETPKDKDLTEDIMNLTRLRKLAGVTQPIQSRV